MLSLSGFAYCQFRTDSLLEKILKADTDSILQKLIQEPDSFRVQIIYTQIDRDARNRPHFKNYYFHVSGDLYFFIRLPLLNCPWPFFPWKNSHAHARRR
jgi:hypothetical protein